jgi:hypothetical protein
LSPLRRHLTYANVVATLALFLVLSGGAAYAAAKLDKNSVGTKQLKNGAVTTAKLKNGAVTTAKLKNGAVTGAKVAVSSLGTVPSATSASHADSATSAGHAESATTAGHADNATNAAHADSATQAENASNAANAAALQGMSAAQVAALATVHCPTGTALAAGFCFETSARLSATYLAAMEACGVAGRLLPSTTELTAYFKVTAGASSGEEWAGQLYYDPVATAYRAEAMSFGPGGSSSSSSADLISAQHRFRCVVPPSN